MYEGVANGKWHDDIPSWAGMMQRETSGLGFEARKMQRMVLVLRFLV